MQSSIFAAGVVAVAVMLSSSWGAAPRAIIDGPSSVRIAGQKLVLRAADTTVRDAKGYRWTIHPEVRGMDQLTILDGGKSVLVHTIPGRYVVTLTVAGVPGDDGSVDIDSITHDLEVPGESPCPPPEPSPTPVPVPPKPPTPTPTPTPTPPNPTPGPVDPAPVPPVPTPVPVPVPAGEFGIAPKIADAVKPIATSQRAKLDAVGAALDAVAAQVAAGTITDAATLMEALKPALATIDTPEGKAIRARVLEIFQDTFSANAKGKLAGTGLRWTFADPAAWATLIRETSTGVKAK